MRIYIKESINKIGETVELAGWVNVRRDHGKIIFIDLRDRSGIMQVVFTPANKELYEKANSLRPEWVISVTGKIGARPKGMENQEIETGSIEMQAEKLEILNESKTPPFPIDDEGSDIDEELRLKYRYLDLRRPRLQKNLRLRSEFIHGIRNFLKSRDFTEIETPLLTKATPEGSRDFVVPSRLQPGKFYALPQSPQQYKQLLMVAGFERYFQIARALRDEDLRADRTFEHTQIDVEMSFIKREEIMSLIEEAVATVVESMGYTIKEKPFPIFKYKEAMDKFGADKFDLRSEEEKQKNILAFAWVIDFPLFSAEGGKTEEGRWTYSHNPFTGPRPEDEGKLAEARDIGEILSLQYDLVLNGHEVGGGGIRINKRDLLKKVFEIIGHSSEKIEKDFGHILEAFEMGAPPHGGVALGVERLCAILAGEEHIREVQAFPTTSGGRTAVMDAPSELEQKQLKELHIKID